MQQALLGAKFIIVVAVVVVVAAVDVTGVITGCCRLEWFVVPPVSAAIVVNAGDKG